MCVGRRLTERGLLLMANLFFRRCYVLKALARPSLTAEYVLEQCYHHHSQPISTGGVGLELGCFWLRPRSVPVCIARHNLQHPNLLFSAIVQLCKLQEHGTPSLRDAWPMDRTQCVANFLASYLPQFCLPLLNAMLHISFILIRDDLFL